MQEKKIVVDIIPEELREEIDIDKLKELSIEEKSISGSIPEAFLKDMEGFYKEVQKKLLGSIK